MFTHPHLTHTQPPPATCTLTRTHIKTMFYIQHQKAEYRQSAMTEKIFSKTELGNIELNTTYFSPSSIELHVLDNSSKIEGVASDYGLIPHSEVMLLHSPLTYTLVQRAGGEGADMHSLQAFHHTVRKPDVRSHRRKVHSSIWMTLKSKCGFSRHPKEKPKQSLARLWLR